MRIIGGTLKGRRLFSAQGLDLRPTSDKVREAIFDILQHQVQGQRVLDLFAGTGALGIEALSRGAQRAVFVEESPRSLAVLRRNIEECRLTGQAEILPREARSGIRSLGRRGESFDLIFLDPPYRSGLARSTVKALSKSPVVGPGAWVVAEHSPAEELEDIGDLQRVDMRRYGSTRVSFFRRGQRPLSADNLSPAI